ncbi:MAG: hypothetical protein HOV92_00490 [Streptomyces sp.]|nr:hypothetical protein [Streptomyces sp.]
MSEDYDRREEICPDCQATEANMDARTISVGQDPKTGRMFTEVTWHLDDCPKYTVDRILTEDGVRRAKEQSEWGRTEFPAAHGRLIKAVMKGQFDETAAPFVEALVELVEAQGEDLGRILLPARWAEILNKHFPPGDAPTA